MKTSPALLAALLLFLSACTARAQEPGDTLWTRVYGGLYNESAFACEQTNDGGFIVVGYSYTFGPGDYDCYLLKTDRNGDSLWTGTYGGADTDYGYSVQQTADGGYIICGSTDSFAATYADAWLIKTDSDGDTLWTRTYDGTGGYEASNFVRQTADGGYILSGYTYFVGTEDRDIYLWKTDADGNTLWTRSYGGEGFDIAWCVRQTTDGGYIVAGHTTSFDTGEEVWLLKTDADGDTLWTRLFDHRDDVIARSVQQTGDGGYIVAGNTDPWGVHGDVFLLKTDDNGRADWTKTIGGTADEYGNSVQQTSEGGYIVAGYTWSGAESWFDAYLVKTNSRGRRLWERIYGGSQDEHFLSVRETRDGSFIAAGDTRSFGAGAGDFYLLKIAGDPPSGPPVSIDIVPHVSPVVVPQGESFSFDGTLASHAGDPQTFDAWIMADVPGYGPVGPLRRLDGITLSPEQLVTVRNLQQGVPDLAPPGIYGYIAYCGDYPWAVTDSSYFEVEVVSGN